MCIMIMDNRIFETLSILNLEYFILKYKTHPRWTCLRFTGALTTHDRNLGHFCFGHGK